MWMDSPYGDCLEQVACTLPRVTWHLKQKNIGISSPQISPNRTPCPYHALLPHQPEVTPSLICRMCAAFQGSQSPRSPAGGAPPPLRCLPLIKLFPQLQVFMRQATASHTQLAWLLARIPMASQRPHTPLLSHPDGQGWLNHVVSEWQPNS